MKYRKLMKVLTIEPDEYTQLKRAFQGGFTHANNLYVNQIIKDNVYSMDFTSSYPAVLLAEKFPMGKAKNVKIKSDKQLEVLLKNYCCVFDLEMWGVKPKIKYENYLSQSRCMSTEKALINNGRIYSADYISTTVTETDFEIIKKCYSCESYAISHMRIYNKGYLPKNFIQSMLDLYETKTQLKGVEGKEAEYMNAKENLNSMYGMCVTDIARPEIVYSDNWDKELPDYDEAIKKNNKSIKRFLFYPWGVWVTAYARRNLWTAIEELGEDYIYSDTDSVKFLNFEKHQEYFDNYNKKMFNRLNDLAIERGLDFDQMMPITQKGQQKLIGVWDYEGYYTMFKTLGAKRYMVVKDGKLSFTVSGLNKEKAIPYLFKKYQTVENIFVHFDMGLEVPAKFTGKLTHTYVDEPYTCFVRDYQGKIAEVHEESFVHLEPADYSLDISDAFVKFITGVRDETF